MNRKIFGSAILSTLVVAGSLLAAAPSFARGFGPGGSGGASGNGTGIPMAINASELGIFDDVVDAAIADLLSITVAEVQAAHAEGITAADLAALNDVDVETLNGVIGAARAQAVADAVADGLISAEQGEFLLERVGSYGGVGMNAQLGETLPGTGYGASVNAAGRGFRQAGQGQMGSGMVGMGASGDCLLGD